MVIAVFAPTPDVVGRTQRVEYAVEVVSCPPQENMTTLPNTPVPTVSIHQFGVGVRAVVTGVNELWFALKVGIYTLRTRSDPEHLCSLRTTILFFQRNL